MSIATRVTGLVLALWLSSAPASAQTTMAAAKCTGGSLGADGFRLGKATASVAILQATQEQRTISSQVIAVDNWNGTTNGAPTCGWPRQRTIADFGASYDAKRNASGALTITRNYSGKVQQQLYLASNASFAYAVADLYSNNSLGITLTQSYGGGAGYARGRFEVDGDLRYIDEKFMPDGDNHKLFGAGLSARANLPLTFMLKAAALTPAVTIVPVFNESDAWLANATLDLFLPFNGGVWGVSMTAQNNYVRNAPAGFRRNYLKTGIGITFSPK